MAKGEFTQVLCVDELNKNFRKLRDLRNTIYKLQDRKRKRYEGYEDCDVNQLWWLDEDEEFIKEYERVCGEYWNWLRAVRNWLTSNYVDANIADGILSGFSNDILD